MFRFTVNTIRNRDNLSCEFDVETIDAAIQILNDQGENLALAFDTFHDQAVSAESEGTDVAETEGKPKRTRRTKAQIAADKAAAEAVADTAPPAPPVAVAPPPIPVPATAATAVKEGIEIPGFLDRTGKAPEVPPPPPPPAPAPVAPPATVLAQKVVEELKRRATGAPDGGKSIVDWLVAIGAVVKGATFEESLSVMLFLEADKLTPIAAALGVQ